MEITLRRPSQSIEIIEFARDMALAQQDMNVAHKGSSNPFFKSKYADWQEVVDASRPALSKNGFSVFLDFEEINQKCYLVCFSPKRSMERIDLSLSAPCDKRYSENSLV